MIAAATSPAPSPARATRSSPRQARVGSRSWALTKWVLRDLAPSQIMMQGIGIAVSTAFLLLAGSMSPAVLIVGDKTITVTFVGGYTIMALSVAVIGNVTHGIVMAARTPILLRAGTTRTMLLPTHAMTAVLLGTALMALVGILTAVDLVVGQGLDLDRGESLILPWAIPAALPTALVGYFVGLSTGLLFLRQHWLLAVAKLLLGINVVYYAIVVAVVEWGQPAGTAGAGLAAVLLIVFGPVEASRLLLGYQPRR